MSKIESFEIDIPQLKRSRTVWVYLPDNYKQTGAPFPVIYMQDGQNLFYEKLCSGGKSWHIDRTMDEIFDATGRSAIVIGLESNEKHRLSEYSPWKMANRGVSNCKIIPKNNRGGEGKAFAEFFAKTLKPAIDSKYNTDKERIATAVIGSSMGGVISCYLGLTYQRIFETMGLFSTWTKFNQGAFNRFVKSTPQTLPQHALIYCGGKEMEKPGQAQKIVNGSLSLYNMLKKRDIKCELLLNADFVHDETAWEVYFRKFALDFLSRYYSQKQA